MFYNRKLSERIIAFSVKGQIEILLYKQFVSQMKSRYLKDESAFLRTYMEREIKKRYREVP